MTITSILPVDLVVSTLAEVKTKNGSVIRLNTLGLRHGDCPEPWQCHEFPISAERGPLTSWGYAKSHEASRSASQPVGGIPRFVKRISSILGIVEEPSVVAGVEFVPERHSVGYLALQYSFLSCLVMTTSNYRRSNGVMLP